MFVKKSSLALAFGLLLLPLPSKGHDEGSFIRSHLRQAQSVLGCNANDPDTTKPTIVCPDDITVAVDDDDDSCSTEVKFGPKQANDNCPNFIVTSSPESGSLFPATKTTEVTMTVTDAAGLKAPCSFNITVDDTKAPDVTCPKDITQDTGLGVCTASVTFTPTATDNCDDNVDVTTSIASGSTFTKGGTTVSALATDDYNNTDTCTFKVTVEDNEAPNVACPGSITKDTDTGACSTTVNFTVPGATDNCDTNVTVTTSKDSGSSFTKGVTTVTTSATDDDSNTATCNFTVTVKDNEAPNVTCPGAITAQNDAGACNAKVTFTPTATDNCDKAVSITSVPASGSSFVVGTTTVSASATDDDANTDTCSFNITVEDKEAPKFGDCSEFDFNSGNDKDKCSAIVNFDLPTATDNCDTSVSVTANPAVGTSFNVGTTTVTATATDDYGNNATCTFAVVVADSQPPSINCPAGITKDNDSGKCHASVVYATPTVDNCNVTSKSFDPLPSGSNFAVGTTTVTATAKDQANNSGSCSFKVTVIDKEVPVITCPSNVADVGNDEGVCGAIVTFQSPTATDNCLDKVKISADPMSGSFFTVGTTTVAASAADTRNKATCNFTVTVVDSEPPIFDACPDVTQDTDNGACNASVSFTPTATDNCDDNVNVTTDIASASTFAKGNTTVKASATDDYSNTATCTFKVAVEDNEAPVVKCPSAITEETDPGSCSAMITFDAPSATDNCDTDVAVTIDFPSGSSFESGVTTVTASATDDDGNTATCNFTVAVEDNEPPNITSCPDITVDQGDSGPLPSVTDNCGSDGITTTTDPEISSLPAGTTTLVTGTATDAAGNSASCSFNVTVVSGGGDGGGGGGGGGGIGCFSHANTIEVLGRGLISIDSLSIGDFVRASKDRFSRVIGFTHLNQRVVADFLQIHAIGLKAPLELTPEHMVFVNNGAPIPASQVKVGDILGENKVVETIKPIKRKGVYAPLTESGDIVVNGVLASSYAAVHSYTPVNQHWEAHAFFAARRLVCGINFGVCKGETYTDGFPDWLSPMVHFALSTGESPFLQAVASIVGLPFITAAYILEQVILFSLPLKVLALIVFFLHKIRFGKSSGKVKAA